MLLFFPPHACTPSFLVHDLLNIIHIHVNSNLRLLIFPVEWHLSSNHWSTTPPYMFYFPKTQDQQRPPALLFLHITNSHLSSTWKQLIYLLKSGSQLSIWWKFWQLHWCFVPETVFTPPIVSDGSLIASWVTSDPVLKYQPRICFLRVFLVPSWIGWVPQKQTNMEIGIAEV